MVPGGVGARDSGDQGSECWLDQASVLFLSEFIYVDWRLNFNRAYTDFASVIVDTAPSIFSGASQERGESYYVPGTGEEMVGRPTNFSPVPGTFTPKIGTHPHFLCDLHRLCVLCG